MKSMQVHHGGIFDAVRHFPVNHAPKSIFPEDTNARIPKAVSQGEVVLHVRAVAMNSHETYGNISTAFLSGTVEAGKSKLFMPGTEVYGMASSTYESSVDEFIVTDTSGLARKPKNLSWPESAAVAKNGLAAWQALFVKAGIPKPDMDGLAASGIPAMQSQQRGDLMLVTEASGEMGIYLVQLGALAGLHVVAATRSRAQDEAFLTALGAAEVVEYSELRDEVRFFDYVINPESEEDTLSQAWQLVANGGTLISMDPAHFNFVQNRPAGNEHVRALFAVPEPSSKDLYHLSLALELGFVKPFVAETVSSEDILALSEQPKHKRNRRGSVISMIEH